jgi:hypothetical protein
MSVIRTGLRCDACRWWRRGECRRNPPAFLAGANHGVWAWSRPEDWCGEFGVAIPIPVGAGGTTREIVRKE